MSHELRTPMNAILGFAQLLENNPKEQLSKVQKDHTRQILKGGAHLLELIDNVLELSKIEAGKTALSIESVAPGPVIDDCLSMVETQSKDNNIQLNYTPGKDDLPLLRTDRNRFKQVLLNLLSNAIKYNRNGGSVTMTTELAADNFLRINIADTGLGIPIEKQYGLFEPFNRLGREAGEIEGTGIGLTITKQVMELLGGRIGFNSTPDVGSTFWIELPVSENQSIELTDTDAVMADISHNEDHFRSSVILYIEDNPANLELMKAIIERFANLKLESAHTAELGLVVAKDIQPDLILMDINLPGMDGIAALNRLRMDDRTKDIPVIAVSAGVMPNEIERGMAAGFEDFIAKPINVPQVVDAIGKHIEQN